MEHPEGEGGSVQPNREERKEIVPGFNEEELFEFSLDQIMNGNLDERREVVEYLVDEFDEMSLCMVEGLRRFANRDAIQDREHEDEDEEEDETDSDEEDQTNGNEPEASTSKQTHKPSKRSTMKRSVQHNDDHEDKDISKREQQRQIYRNYWRHLKQNPMEYAKALKRMSDYHKQRLDGMTEQERDKFNEQRREYSRYHYHSLSLEDKTKRIREINEWKRNKMSESEEYREKVRQYNRKYSAKLTEEQKAKKRKQDRNFYLRSRQNMTEDQRKLARQKNADAQKRWREKKKNNQK